MHFNYLCNVFKYQFTLLVLVFNNYSVLNIVLISQNTIQIHRTYIVKRNILFFLSLRSNMAVSNTKVNRFKLVAAIEIGTPFSTYAFSTVNGFQKDPLDIQQIKTWYSDSKRKGITKTSTCLLLDQKLRFVSFGNDAQEEYAQLKHTKKNTEYLFFRHFNLQLYESKVR